LSHASSTFSCFSLFFGGGRGNLGLNLGLTPWANPPALFLWWVFSEIGSWELFTQGWLWTAILLISASPVARITGVSHRRLACYSCFLNSLKLMLSHPGCFPPSWDHRLPVAMPSLPYAFSESIEWTKSEP
jgi:hypothetical protein